jgi:hypothetical protein
VWFVVWPSAIDFKVMFRLFFARDKLTMVRAPSSYISTDVIEPHTSSGYLLMKNYKNNAVSF